MTRRAGRAFVLLPALVGLCVLASSVFVPGADATDKGDDPPRVLERPAAVTDDPGSLILAQTTIRFRRDTIRLVQSDARSRHYVGLNEDGELCVLGLNGSLAEWIIAGTCSSMQAFNVRGLPLQTAIPSGSTFGMVVPNGYNSATRADGRSTAARSVTGNFVDLTKLGADMPQRVRFDGPSGSFTLDVPPQARNSTDAPGSAS
jgi:hypothetical protein